MEQNIYKYETHCHTKQGSACGVNTGAEMARFYYNNGYSGIIVTDHFFNGNTAIDRSLPWEGKIELFYDGYEDAASEGDKLGLKVFFGWEFGYRGADILTYGLDKDFLLKYKDLHLYKIDDYANLIHSEGGYLVHAHPFRLAPYLPESGGPLFPELVDAVEVRNIAHRDLSFDKKAYDYAKKHNLDMISGSDNHSDKMINPGGMAFDRKCDTVQDLICLIKSRTGTVIGL